MSLKNPYYEDAGACTREKPHHGACNGFVTWECVGFVEPERRVSSPETRALKDQLTPGAMDSWKTGAPIPPAEKHVGIGERVGTKESNPKDAIASNRVPLGLVPPLTPAYASLAHLNGALKYGKWNWRSAGVRASVYVDAVKRHIEKWENGEELDEDGVPHLGSIIANTGIVLDARACGKLTDDRPPRLSLTGIFEGLEKLVSGIREKHKDKTPRHYTIDDSEVCPGCLQKTPKQIEDCMGRPASCANAWHGRAS